MRHPHALRIAQNEKTRQWYWRLVAENGRTVADGGEGYHNEADCLHGIRLVKGGAATAPVRRAGAGLLGGWVEV